MKLLCEGQSVGVPPEPKEACQKRRCAVPQAWVSEARNYVSRSTLDGIDVLGAQRLTSFGIRTCHASDTRTFSGTLEAGRLYGSVTCTAYPPIIQYPPGAFATHGQT